MNSVCFTKTVVKIEAFPNATPTSKIWKNLSVDQKDERCRSVWVGHADFSKIAQRKQKFIKVSIRPTGFLKLWYLYTV